MTMPSRRRSIRRNARGASSLCVGSALQLLDAAASRRSAGFQAARNPLPPGRSERGVSALDYGTSDRPTIDGYDLPPHGASDSSTRSKPTNSSPSSEPDGPFRWVGRWPGASASTSTWPAARARNAREATQLARTVGLDRAHGLYTRDM